MVHILELKNFSVTLDGQSILEHVSFSLEKGETLAVIGPNGSGKTVLLKSLLGTIEGAGTLTWAPDTRVAYVPQKIDADRHLPINFTNLLRAKANVMKLDTKAIDEVIADVGLTKEILTTPVGHLSGGQFQRCLIAFALLGNPDIILFDEPTASIDQSGEEQIYELIHRLQDERGLTAIVVSHDLSFVYRFATKVLCLNRQNICFGNPQEALTPEVLKKLYGTPFAYYHHIHKHP